MTGATWWMRIVGVFYLLQFVIAAIIQLPILALAPEGTLALATAGDPVAGLLVDTWVLFGLDLLVVSGALLIASRVPAQAKVLIWTVLGFELFRGIGHDIYMMARGHEPTPLVIWIIIHLVIITSGLLALRKERSA